MSVGMATLEEIEAACKVLKKETDRIALLHCISAYPIREEDANLTTIYDLRNSFDYPVGYSDHTNDIAVPLYAVAAGAQIIEKHFKIDEAMECIDAPVSITETQMKKLVQEICRVERILGEGPQYGVRNVEKATKQFRRVSEI
jgi:sialic acid synthase SpsE